MSGDNEPVLSGRHISKWYSSKATTPLTRGSRHQVLFDVSVDLYRNEVLAVIGSSGSGKTTLTRILLGMGQPDEGSVTYEGDDIRSGGEGARRLRRESGIVFQDPFSSLDPRWRIGRSVAEPLVLQHREWGREKIRAHVELPPIHILVPK